MPRRQHAFCVGAPADGLGNAGVGCAQAGGVGCDSHAPQVEPVGVPAGADGGVVGHQPAVMVGQGLHQHLQASGVQAQGPTPQVARQRGDPRPMPWIAPVVLAPAVVQHREAQDDARIPSGLAMASRCPLAPTRRQWSPPWIWLARDGPAWARPVSTTAISTFSTDSAICALTVTGCHWPACDTVRTPSQLAVHATRDGGGTVRSGAPGTAHTRRVAWLMYPSPRATTRATHRGHGNHVYGTGDRGNRSPGQSRYATSRYDAGGRRPGSGAPTPPLHVAIAAASASGAAGQAQLS